MCWLHFERDLIKSDQLVVMLFHIMLMDAAMMHQSRTAIWGVMLLGCNRGLLTMAPETLLCYVYVWNFCELLLFLTALARHDKMKYKDTAVYDKSNLYFFHKILLDT